VFIFHDEMCVSRLHHFTTIHIDGGRPVFPYAHARRLILQSDIKLDATQIVEELYSEAKFLENGVLRAGVSADGLLFFKTRAIRQYSQTSYRIAHRRIKVRQAGLHTHKIFPHPISSLERPESIDEWLWLNEEGVVLEGEWSNVWFEDKGRLFTPSLELPILQGIMRTAIIQIAEVVGIPIEEGHFRLNEYPYCGLSSALKYLVFTGQPHASSVFNIVRDRLWSERFSNILDLKIAAALHQSNR
jgi:hypothetical protein